MMMLSLFAFSLRLAMHAYHLDQKVSGITTDDALSQLI